MWSEGINPEHWKSPGETRKREFTEEDIHEFDYEQRYWESGESFNRLLRGRLAHENWGDGLRAALSRLTHT